MPLLDHGESARFNLRFLMCSFKAARAFVYASLFVPLCTFSRIRKTTIFSVMRLLQLHTLLHGEVSPSSGWKGVFSEDRPIVSRIMRKCEQSVAAPVFIYLAQFSSCWC